MANLLRPLLVLVSLALLSGCGALSAASSASDPLDTYTLTPLAAVQNPPPGRLHLVVELPSSGGALATDRILIKPTSVQAQYLPDARWSDPAPALVQSLMVASLLNRGGLRLVGRTGAGLMPDYTLMTEVQEFQAEVTAAGSTQVQITLRMTLIRESDRSIAATRQFAATAASSSDATLSLVEAFDRAMQAVLAEAVPWVNATI